MRKKIYLFSLGAALILFYISCKDTGSQHTLTFTLLQTSDLHNHASGYGASLDYTPKNNADNDGVVGGYSRIAGIISAVRNERKEENNPVVVVDSGDFSMGTIYDLAAADPVSLKFMQMAGYDAITLGNHEFDWSPTGLRFLLHNSIEKGFTVPIIATNMVTDRTSGVDDGIEALENEGAIVKKRVLELPNGLRIGILGIMGVNADVKAPAALPITFNHEYKFLQERVDALRIIDGVNIVVLLSHGGVSSAGIGDDEVIAANVSGIDIIASGHYHTATPVPFIRGNSHTVIFSPGEYGEWVSRLDVTYNTESGRIEKTDFTLIPVNDTIRVNKIFEVVINSYQGVVDQFLTPSGYSLDMPVSRVSWRIEIPGGTESGLGNLVADAVRAMASNLAALNDGNLYHVAVVPNGVIRDGLFPGKTGIVTFTDVYNTIPLGKSADAGQLLPGYPLISLYVTGADLRNICEAGLTVGALLGSDFYLNFSGIRVDYNPAKAPQLQGVRAVYLSFPDDYFTAEKGMPIDITDTQTLYHMVVNLYSLQMMNEVTRMGLTIIPRDAMGNPIAPGEYMQYRIDSGLDAGIQELKEWMALLSYLNNFFPASGEGISPAVYGNNGSAMGRTDIVNY